MGSLGPGEKGERFGLSQKEVQKVWLHITRSTLNLSMNLIFWPDTYVTLFRGWGKGREEHDFIDLVHCFNN